MTSPLLLDRKRNTALYRRKGSGKETVMRRTLVLLALNALLSFGAFAADDLFDGDVFVGYSLFRANSAQQQIPAFNANGGLGSLAWNINGHLGIEAEFAGHHNGGALDTTQFSYLFGPRLSYGRTKRFD